MRRIRVTSKFKKSFRKLPKEVQKKAKDRELLFRENPFDPRLDTHKLHGKYKHLSAFTVVGQYRILFAFTSGGGADFINIGTHEIYK